MNILALDELLQKSLQEDIGFGDVTGEAIFDNFHLSEGYLVAKQEIVLAGLEVFARVFALLNPKIDVRSAYYDGDKIPLGEKFASVAGPTRALLAGERVALNFLQRMCGIATQTAYFVEACRGYGATIVDTRKTTPGLRMLEKYAVTVGGGKNHRYSLDSMVLIKDNHIKAAGGIGPAVKKVRGKVSPFMRIEVETETLDQVCEALEAKADVIMLDNMTVSAIREAVELIGRRALVEVSGNVTLERVPELAATGVDIISSGALTHSVKAADISMRLV